MGEEPKYRRILLKVSGEALMGPEGFGVHFETVTRLAKEVAEIRAIGVEVALVVGGGNFFRGASSPGQLERATADMVGMLGTVMNGLILQDALEKTGVSTRVLSATLMPQVCELFVRRRAVRHLEKGRIVIFVAGTGHPYFSTDTGAVLRALEIGANAILKGTKVEGIYSADPVLFPSATLYKTITYEEVLRKGLRVMDQTAIALCRENSLPLHVFNIRVPGNLLAVVMGEPIGTFVGG